MDELTLQLIRHPRPLVEPGICYGRLDVAAENATPHARRLLAELPPGLPVWSSPLQRCRVLACALHPEPLLDARLAEMDFGAWEGLAWDAVPRQQLDAWAADVAGYAPPGGESPRQLQARALAFVEALDVPEAVLVTHAGVIRTLVAHQQGLSPDSWLALEFAYASRTVLVIRR